MANSWIEGEGVIGELYDANVKEIAEIVARIRAEARAAALAEAEREARTWKAVAHGSRGYERRSFEAGGERTCQIIAERIRALLSAASPGQPEETKHGG